MNKQMWAALLAALSMNGVQAYDDAAVSTLLNDAVRARNQKAVAPPPGVARAAALGTDETPDVIASIDKLNEAFEQLLRGCDGRTGVLRSKLEKQTLRAERISIGGSGHEIPPIMPPVYPRNGTSMPREHDRRRRRERTATERNRAPHRDGV